MRTNRLLKFLLLPFCAITFINCSDKESPTDLPMSDETNDIYINSAAPQGTITVEAMKSNVTPFLGSGYDITGEYISNLSVKAPVLDLAKVGDDRITIINATSGEGDLFAGRNIKELLQSINSEYRKYPVPAENREDLLFTGTITSHNCFKERYDHSSQYTFALENSGANISVQRIMTLNPKWDSWLTDNFREALELYSPEEVIQEFGTHVLVDIHLGYMIKTLYRSVVADSETELLRTAIAGLRARKDMIYKTPNISVTHPEETVKKNYGGTIVVSFQGGDYKKIPPLQLTPDGNVIGEPMNISPWVRTCNEETYALTTLSGKDMILIYDVITDPIKKQQIKEAVINHIKIHQPAIQQTVPVFQAIDEKSYRYYTSFPKSAEEAKACRGVIASVFVHQESNTVPLYLSSSKKGDRLSLDEPQEGRASTIGYVYKNRINNSECIYEISDGKSFAYTREYKDSYGEKGTWKQTGKYFYSKKV